MAWLGHLNWSDFSMFLYVVNGIHTLFILHFRTHSHRTSLIVWIRFNIMMSLCDPPMINVCYIPFVFSHVHNTILYSFLSCDVPMVSLLIYFCRSDKNKDDQSLISIDDVRRPWYSVDNFQNGMLNIATKSRTGPVAGQSLSVYLTSHHVMYA